MMTWFWLVVAYVTTYLLGVGRGQARERDREDRAFKKAEERMKERR